MLRLSAWLVQVRGAGWFTRGASGSLFPFPFLWQGWALFGGFLLLLVGTILIRGGDIAWPMRILAVLAYLGIAYWTIEPDR
ncbi:hypothetical protein IAG41_19680 [Sphingomonas sp. JC676]|uniref:hypothetical protein n=1 Tax=Sphingomonas sp. JC676 TaxID=2768065 RepID=UPI001657D04D|nr:hypothetical protein [Sphingomonas sp. JC676]MBC9034616.1 hypothetical protein [Sphingomonas sp. JC676]